MSSTGSFIICALIIIGAVTSSLTVFLQESLGLGAFKPNFTDTELGKKCSEIWDDIQKYKAKPRDRQTGMLTKEAEYYEDCWPTYAGNPSLGTNGTLNKSVVAGALENGFGNFSSYNLSNLLNLTSNTTINR